MIFDDWQPDIIIGVDFGMTCTGVAYAEAPEWGIPQPIQTWPGKSINELSNKVPTQLGYHRNQRQVKAWGFLSEQEEEELDIEELFKLYLDPRHTKRYPDDPSPQEANSLFRDYLACLHAHIDQYFYDTNPRWSSTKAEFIFSVPTSWNDPSMIAETLKSIREAGFGQDGPFRRIHIGLTEAESAAVYAAREQFQRGDVILVCDAGGGTTDVNVLKVMSARGEPTKLEQMTFVQGSEIGSTFIDQHFHRLITDQLSKVENYLSDSPESCADRTLRGKFERFKCYFGAGAGDVEELPLEVQGLKSGSVDLSHVGIQDSRIKLKREALKAAFDSQVNPALDLIDKQAARVERRYPGEQISYLILSGGFGSSPYLRQQLRSRFEGSGGQARVNMQQTRIILSKKPQLAVVLGLVTDRIQQVTQQTTVFNEVCCRLSYGMVCREVYNPVKHVGEQTEFDPRVRKTYAINQIDWFVKQDVNVPTSGVSKPYLLKFDPDKGKKLWQSQIVTSELPEWQLPKSMRHGRDQVRTVCNVDALLDDINMKVKNRHWYSRGKRYLRAAFDVRVVIGHADLSFRILDKTGKNLSRDDSTISVSWGPPQIQKAASENHDMAAEAQEYGDENEHQYPWPKLTSWRSKAQLKSD